MKYLKLFLIMFTFMYTNIFSKNSLNGEELIFRNYTGSSIYNISIHPMSAVFNANLDYNLVSTKRSVYFAPNKADYINGCNFYDSSYQPNTSFNLGSLEVGLELDPDGGATSDVYGIFSFGIYKIEVSYGGLDSIILDIDAGEFPGDLTINFYNSNPKVTYQFSGYPEISLTPDSCVIRSWKPYGQSQTSSKNLGSFTYSNGTTLTPNSYIILPQDSRRDCHILVGVPNLNQDYVDTRNGDISLNLTIKKDVSTPNYSQMIDFPTRITILPAVKLEIDSNKTLNFTQVVSNDPDAYFEMYVENDGRLKLLANSKIIISNKNRLKLSYNSRLYLGTGAEILVEQGGFFCNVGALIRGNGHIIYKGGSIPHIQCNQLADYLVKDSTKFILDSNAVLEIPDNTTLHFFGNQTGLIMKPNSKLKMGEGSKILFDSSASLIANGATFTSIDSTMKWDGIVLSNTDADTITNCTFSNAVTAITITNDANAAYKNRIITNNTFNIPSGGICKGIYGENNYKILLKENTFNMPVYFPSASPVPLIYVGVYLKNSSTIEAAGGDIEEDQCV